MVNHFLFKCGFRKIIRKYSILLRGKYLFYYLEIEIIANILLTEIIIEAQKETNTEIVHTRQYTNIKCLYNGPSNKIPYLKYARKNQKSIIFHDS